MPFNANGIRHLIAHFGSGAHLSRAAGISRTAAYHWLENSRQPQIEPQRNIVRKAPRVGLSYEEAADAVGADRCPCCSCFIDGEIRDLVEGRRR